MRIDPGGSEHVIHFHYERHGRERKQIVAQTRAVFTTVVVSCADDPRVQSVIRSLRVPHGRESSGECIRVRLRYDVIEEEIGMRHHLRRAPAGSECRGAQRGGARNCNRTAVSPTAEGRRTAVGGVTNRCAFGGAGDRHLNRLRIKSASLTDDGINHESKISRAILLSGSERSHVTRLAQSDRRVLQSKPREEIWAVGSIIQSLDRQHVCTDYESIREPA